LNTLRLAALSLLLLPSIPTNVVAGTPPQPHRLAPGVKILRDLRHLERPPFRPEVVDGDGFVGSVRLVRPGSDELLEVLAARGVDFLRTGGRVRRLGAVYPARIPFDQLPWLAEHPDVVQVSTDFLLPPIAPLDQTRPQTGAGTFSEYLEGVIGERPGEGMVIADFDHGIDPFHPGLFFADGGYYAWTDADGDGVLTPGADGVDVDGDGDLSDDEVLHAFDAVLWNPYAEPRVQNTNGFYDPGLDWLFLDQDGSGAREWGADAGATDQTAAFGEPVFVVDDVDGDRVVDPGEKLVLLRTSKLRSVRVGDAVYERGLNLSALDPDLFGGSWGYEQAGHGTGVTGILVANTPRMSRFVGMAPYAEVVLVDSSTGADSAYGYMERLIWAGDQGAQLFLHEYSSWGVDHMDGTSNYDQALDALVTDHGIPQVCPAGNLAESGKHALSDAPPGTTPLRFEIPDEYPDYPGYGFEVPYIYITLYFAGDPGDVVPALSIPGLADPVPLPEDTWEGEQLAGQIFGGAWTGQSPGGFAVVTMLVMTEDRAAPLPSGEWTVHVDNIGVETLSVHGFLNDSVTGWSRGPVWLDGESPDSTLCAPSTATEALSVAAYAGVHDGAEGQGNLRGYSSRGPRMDGEIKLGLAAPDDPFTTLPSMAVMPYANEVLHGAYTVFGGTSGAGPHAAGALALLMQAADGLSAQAAVQAMYDGALHSPDMGTLPNKDWGHGKLDVHKAALGVAAWENAPPAAEGVAKDTGGYCVVLNAAGSADPDGDPLTFRWDADYDGGWDTEQSDDPETVVELEGPAKGIARLRVYDDKGAFAEALVAWEAAETTPLVEPATTADATAAQDGVSETDTGPDRGDYAVRGDDAVSAGGRGKGGCGVAATPAAAPWFLLLPVVFLPVRRGLCSRHPMQ